MKTNGYNSKGVCDVGKVWMLRKTVQEYNITAVQLACDWSTHTASEMIIEGHDNLPSTASSDAKVTET